MSDLASVSSWLALIESNSQSRRREDSNNPPMSTMLDIPGIIATTGTPESTIFDFPLTHPPTHPPKITIIAHRLACDQKITPDLRLPTNRLRLFLFIATVDTVKPQVTKCSISRDYYEWKKVLLSTACGEIHKFCKSLVALKKQLRGIARNFTEVCTILNTPPPPPAPPPYPLNPCIWSSVKLFVPFLYRIHWIAYH